MKKILLFALPALMLFSSCAGTAPKAEQNYLEDTLAHNELFGQQDAGFKKARRNTTPDIDDTSVPYAGIQTYENGDNISIRFIAAIKVATGKLPETSAVWNRVMYKANGEVYSPKAAADMPCEVAYTSVINKGEEYTIGDFNTEHGGTDYTHFVVYTMLNIPKTERAGYYLNAYVTLNGNKTSRVYSTTVDQSRQASYPVGQTGYFLSGTFDGEKGVKEADGSAGTGNKAKFSNAALKANDTFVIVQNNASGYAIYGNSCLYGAKSLGYFEKVNNGKMKTKCEGSYTLTLNDDDQLSSTVSTSVDEGYYLAGEFSGWDLFTENVMESHDSGDNYADITFDVAERGNFKVVKVEKGQENVWYGDPTYNDNVWLEAGNYDIRLQRSDSRVYTTKNSSYSFEVYLSSDEAGSTGNIYVQLTGTDIENAPAPGVLVTSCPQSGPNYVVNFYGGYTSATFNYVVSGEIKKHLSIAINDIGNGIEVKRASWTEDETNKFWLGLRPFAEGDFTQKTDCDVLVNIRVYLQTRGDISSQGAFAYIVGEFCNWDSTDGNAIKLAETEAGSKIWIGTVIWQYGESYEYKVRLNTEDDAWKEGDNWYPGMNQTLTVSASSRSIDITW